MEQALNDFGPWKTIKVGQLQHEVGLGGDLLCRPSGGDAIPRATAPGTGLAVLVHGRPGCFRLGSFGLCDSVQDVLQDAARPSRMLVCSFPPGEHPHY
jgi:hypothetical protein